MFCKVVFRVGLCVVLLIIVSCSTHETMPAKDIAQVEDEKTSIDDLEVIIALGDKELTMQQARWMQQDAENQSVSVAKIANWWLENELLYAEAQRRGIVNQPKAKLIAELTRKKSFAKELVLSVQNAVEISDEQVLAYYEKNKDTDSRLKLPGYLDFSHVRTKTLEEAESILEILKAGEDINTLAIKLSIFGDAKRGGIVQRFTYRTVKKRFGAEFFELLAAAEKNEFIGPVKIGNNAYEVARQDSETEPKILPFEKVKNKIKSRLEQTEKRNAIKSLLDSLKEKAADKIVKSPLIAKTSQITAGQSRQNSQGKQR